MSRGASLASRHTERLPARGGLECGLLRRGQGKRGGKQAEGIALGRSIHTAFERSDGADADSRPLRQLLLRQPGKRAIPS
jgi:hypothetical protein